MISDVLAIDPGTRALGWARASGTRITGAGLSRLPDARDLAGAAARHARAIGCGSARVAVVESMRYATDRRTTPQTLIDVQTVGCLVARAIAPVVVLLAPEDWKGAIPKEIHHPRILDVLDPTERAIVDAAAAAAGKTNAKEVLDAVGILLYHLGRTNRSGGPRT